MAALACYFDDSRYFPDDEAEGVAAIAGYLATVRTWDEEFSPAWSQAIENAPHTIREFKASDCRQQQGEFEDWTREECDDLTKKLISIIVDDSYNEPFMGFGCAVEMPTAESTEWRRKLQDFALMLCVSAVLKPVFGAAEALTGSDAVHLVFDRQPKLQGHIWSAFDRLEDALDDDAAARIRSPQFEKSHHLEPLQAADILAYETRKEFEEKHSENPRSVSKALRVLVDGRAHFARYYKREDLLAIFQKGQRGEVSEDAVFQGPVLYRSSERPRFRIPRDPGLSIRDPDTPDDG